MCEVMQPTLSSTDPLVTIMVVVFLKRWSKEMVVVKLFRPRVMFLVVEEVKRSGIVVEVRLWRWR